MIKVLRLREKSREMNKGKMMKIPMKKGKNIRRRIMSYLIKTFEDMIKNHMITRKTIREQERAQKSELQNEEEFPIFFILMQE